MACRSGKGSLSFQGEGVGAGASRVEEGSQGGAGVLCETPGSPGMKGEEGGLGNILLRIFSSVFSLRNLPVYTQRTFSRMFTPALYLTTKTLATPANAHSQGVGK